MSKTCVTPSDEEYIYKDDIVLYTMTLLVYKSFLQVIFTFLNAFYVPFFV